MILVDVRDKVKWHADSSYKYSTRNLSKINKIVLHCDDGGTTWESINRYDIRPNHISKKGCPSFTYHYFVGQDNKCYWCMDPTWVTWHAGNHNLVSLGVCISYRATGALFGPASIQLDTTEQLLSKLSFDLYIDPDTILGHRELEGTGYNIVNGVKKLRKECPGLLISMSKIRYNVAKIMQAGLKQLDLYTGAVDGSFGPKSEAALAKFKQLKEAGKVG